jgi:3-hydroxyacyl-[acyl-carrier-protein] dehydratase
MNPSKEDRLSLGAEVVQRLLPHRRPFLMVDRIESYCRGPVPTLRACRFISANEEVFAGHFPGLPLWPGVYTIEGMGQSSNLLEVLLGVQDGFEAHGHKAEEVLQTLRLLEAQTTMGLQQHFELLGPLGDVLAEIGKRPGMSAAVDVKLLAPVFAGQRLDYCTRRTLAMGELRRFEVEAEVGGKLVARGVMDSIVLAASTAKG